MIFAISCRRKGWNNDFSNEEAQCPSATVFPRTHTLSKAVKEKDSGFHTAYGDFYSFIKLPSLSEVIIMQNKNEERRREVADQKREEREERERGKEEGRRRTKERPQSRREGVQSLRADRANSPGKQGS